MSRFRFTLGQLMIVIAVSAVLFAATGLSLEGQHVPIGILSHLVGLAGLAVLLYYVRLSPWMWLALAGGFGSRSSHLVFSLAGSLLMSRYGPAVMITTQLASGAAFTLIFFVGLAMTFRDVGRRMRDGVIPSADDRDA